MVVEGKEDLIPTDNEKRRLKQREPVTYVFEI